MSTVRSAPIAGNQSFLGMQNLAGSLNNLNASGGSVSAKSLNVEGSINSKEAGVGLGTVESLIGYAPTSFSTLATGAGNGVWLNKVENAAAATSTSDQNLLQLPLGARVIAAHATNNGTSITSTVAAPAFSSLTFATGSGPGSTPIVSGDQVIMSNTATGSGTTGIGINAFFGAVVGGPALGLGENGADGVAPNPVGGQGTGYDTSLGVTSLSKYVSVVNNTGVVGDYSVGTVRDTSIELGSAGAGALTLSTNTGVSANFPAAATYVVTVGTNNTYSGSGTGMTFALLLSATNNDDVVHAKPLTRGNGYRLDETITLSQANLRTITGEPTLTVTTPVVFTLGAGDFEDGAGTGVVVQPLGPLNTASAGVTGTNDISLGSSAAGTACTVTNNQTATGLSASSTSGFGSGGVFTITTAGGTAPANATLTMTTAGTGYQLGDKINFAPGVYGGITVAAATLVFTLTAAEVDDATFTTSFVGLPISTRGQTRLVASVLAAPTGALALTTDIPFNPSPNNSSYSIRGGADSGSGGAALTAGDLAIKIDFVV